MNTKVKVKSRLRKRIKKQKGGNLEFTLNPFNLLLLGVIIFLLYQMNQSEPEKIIQKKIIYLYITIYYIQK